MDLDLYSGIKPGQGKGLSSKRKDREGISPHCLTAAWIPFFPVGLMDILLLSRASPPHLNASASSGRPPHPPNLKASASSGKPSLSRSAVMRIRLSVRASAVRIRGRSRSASCRRTVAKGRLRLGFRCSRLQQAGTVVCSPLVAVISSTTTIRKQGEVIIICLMTVCSLVGIRD